MFETFSQLSSGMRVVWHRCVVKEGRKAGGGGKEGRNPGWGGGGGGLMLPTLSAAAAVNIFSTM